MNEADAIFSNENLSKGGALITLGNNLKKILLIIMLIEAKIGIQIQKMAVTFFFLAHHIFFLLTLSSR